MRQQEWGTVSDDLVALAADAYVYGFPLIFDLREVASVAREGLGSLAPAPFNTFGHASKLAGPGDRFVSINNDTMYDLPDFYLVANPIDRYSIGDRTPGLRRDADGSLTIVIQHDQPADTSNWLPAPAAPFRPIMCLYQPQAAVLDGTYKIPPIVKAASSSW
jgi:hypothetical protein